MDCENWNFGFTINLSATQDMLEITPIQDQKYSFRLLQHLSSRSIDSEH